LLNNDVKVKQIQDLMLPYMKRYNANKVSDDSDEDDYSDDDDL
jgi:hypothetical protein